jgi:prepilin-type N-terminal cleavage/methylation domain-containing protein
MLRIIRNQKGFTLIELVIIIILIGLLAAIAIPRYVDLRDQALRASAQATLDAGRAAVMLDFADQILNQGTYTDIFANTAGANVEITDASDRGNLDNELQSRPNYPPNGPYNSPAGEGYRWWQITAGSSSPTPQPPALEGVIDVTCLAADSGSATANQECYVSRL